VAEHPAIARTAPLAPMQRIAAEHLARSLRECVPVTLHGEADAEALAALRARLNADPARAGRPLITYTHLIVKAAAQALRAHPGLNASLAGHEVRYYADIHIGLALALPDGNLVVPVIRNADSKTVDEVAAEAQALEERAVAGKLALAHVQGATFTVSNGGMVPSARWTTPIIPLGQAAILGVGALHEAAVVREGKVVARRVLPTSLTFDHRFVNGVPAARFVDDLHSLLADARRIELGT
jgi:pyruvate dehydrogenase E2 component (dihydrolipoamide acetyltransferase)